MAKLIGITGQIGSGKSTAASVLAKMGAAVVDADQIGRTVVEQNPALVKQIAKVFGNDVLTKSRKLDRKRVAEIAFSSKSNKFRLDKLVHPFLLKELKRQVKKLSRSHDVIVIDAALLLDWSLDRVVDTVLVINASQNKRLARLKKRGISTVDVKARQKHQLSFKEFQRRSDKILMNNSTKLEFEKEVRDWARQFFLSN